MICGCDIEKKNGRLIDSERERERTDDVSTKYPPSCS